MSGVNGMSVLQRNLRALEEKNPDAPALLSRYSPREDVSFTPSSAGPPTAVAGSVYLHSRHDPIREADRLVRSALESDARFFLFYGFGLGYLVERFLECGGDRACLVIEPDVPLFLRALESRDISRLLSHPRVSYLLDAPPELITPFLEEYEEDEVQVVRLRSVYAGNRSFFEGADRTVTAFLSRKQVNRNTLARFGRLWVRNLLRNIRLFAERPGITGLSGRFAGIPALVLAAGPSLDHILPRLGRLRERFLLIAVDTSLRACIARGITPDFTVVVDPQYWNSRHIDAFRGIDTILVSESSTHPRVFRGLTDRIVFCSSLFPLGEYLERFIGKKGALGAGGSVSTSAWDFARFLGCRPIVMAGLDLGFPDRATHYHGSFFEERVHTLSCRHAPPSHHAFLALTGADPFPLPDNRGGTVLTDRRLVIYRQWFENQMRIHPDTDTRTASVGGVAIDGIPFLDPQRLEEFPIVRPQLQPILDETRALTAAATESDAMRAALEDGLAALLAELGSLAALAAEGEAAVRAARKAFSAGQPVGPFFAELDRTDAAIGSREIREVAGFLLQDTARRLSELQRDGAGGIEGNLDQSELLYRDLRASCEEQRDLIEAFLRDR